MHPPPCVLPECGSVRSSHRGEPDSRHSSQQWLDSQHNGDSTGCMVYARKNTDDSECCDLQVLHLPRKPLFASHSLIIHLVFTTVGSRTKQSPKDEASELELLRGLASIFFIASLGFPVPCPFGPLSAASAFFVAFLVTVFAVLEQRYLYKLRRRE